MSEPCKERRTLARAIAATTSLMYSTKRAYDEAQGSKTEAPGEKLQLLIEMSNARGAALSAQHAFDEHVRKHRCKD